MLIDLAPYAILVLLVPWLFQFLWNATCPGTFGSSRLTYRGAIRLLLMVFLVGACLTTGSLAAGAVLSGIRWH